MPQTVSIADRDGLAHELQLCPFCGSDDLWIDEPSPFLASAPQEPEEREMCEGFVMCYECRAAGPMALTLHEVCSLWNRRPAK